MIRKRNEEMNGAEAVAAIRRGPLAQGVVTEVLNPKTALFFLSFIPQFVSVSEGHVVAQFLALGAISITLNTSADIVVACFAGPLGTRMKQSVRFRRRQRTASGLVMAGLGIYVASADSR
jgi:threonine/homoserine/homoserine lactone efflux protein